MNRAPNIIVCIFVALFFLTPSETFAASSSCCCPDNCGAGWSCTSFAPNTPIRLSNGTEVSVEDLKAGQEVQTFDEATGKTATGKVTFKIGRNVEEYYVLEAAGRKVETTNNHPFYVGEDYVSKDPVVAKGYKRVDELKVGDIIHLVENNKLIPVKVDRLTKSNGGPVFSITVSNKSNFVANGFAVHNKICAQDPPPSCEYSNQGCAANGCPQGTSRQCENCGSGWSCSCVSDAGCGPACNPDNWGGCSASCGGGTQTNECGGTQSCNTQPCCTPSCGSPLCGQGDGCGGTCSSADDWWSAWGGCSSVTYTRSRSNACQGTQTENCLGNIVGTIWDATDYSVCPGSMAGLGITGAVTTATSTSISYNATTNTNGAYAISARSPDIYNLSVDPGSTEFVDVPKLYCQGTSVTLSGQGESFTRDVGFLRVYGGWFQAVNGGVYGRTGIASTIPGTMPVAERHLILANASGTDGLAYYKSGSLNLGNYPGVTVSETGYTANSGYDGDPANYQYFKVKMATFDMTAWNGLGQPVYNGGVNNYQIYTSTGDTTINWSPSAGERVIYLIDGNVTVSGNIDVPTSSPTFLAVIANGTITFNTNVTNVEGWWVGNALNFPCVDTSPADGICDETDSQFTGEGSFVGYNSITLARDQYLANNSQPSEKFTYRPDLMINAPEPLYVSKYIWRYQ